MVRTPSVLPGGVMSADVPIGSTLTPLLIMGSPRSGTTFLAHMVMVGVLLIFGLLGGFRLAYMVGIVIITLSLVVEHWLARRRSLNWVQDAFFRLNALVSLVFLAMTATEVVFPFFRMKL